jgi:hypothetical protein
MELRPSVSKEPLLLHVKPDEPTRMQSRRFTPKKFDTNKGARQRVGVPGGELYAYDGSVLLRWSGTALREAILSKLFRLHLSLFGISLIFFSIFGNDDSLKAAAVPAPFATSLNSVSIFVLTFFIGQVFSKATARFENVCKTNGNVTRVSAIAAASLPKRDAENVMRYTNTVLRIYYLLNSGGGMTDKKWDLLREQGMLYPDEIVMLKKQGSPGVVVYSWALETIQSAFDADPKANLLGAQLLSTIEECIGGTRGLSAKQIAYSLYQIPFNYFHTVFFLVNSYLLCTHYDFGHRFAGALNTGCDGTAGGICPSKAGFEVFLQLVLVVIFLSLLLTAANLAECYGDKQYHYDLGLDLDNLWAESKNVLESMDPDRKVKRQ